MELRYGRSAEHRLVWEVARLQAERECQRTVEFLAGLEDGYHFGFVIFTAMARDGSATLTENKNSMSCLKEQKR